MNKSGDYREEIIEIIRQRLVLEKHAVEQFEKHGKLDSVTAVDSMFLVELVTMLEEHFGIRFESQDLDENLLCNLDWLTNFVTSSVAVE